MSKLRERCLRALIDLTRDEVRGQDKLCERAGYTDDERRRLTVAAFVLDHEESLARIVELLHAALNMAAWSRETEDLVVERMKPLLDEWESLRKSTVLAQEDAASSEPNETT